MNSRCYQARFVDQLRVYIPLTPPVIVVGASPWLRGEHDAGSLLCHLVSSHVVF